MLCLTILAFYFTLNCSLIILWFPVYIAANPNLFFFIFFIGINIWKLFFSSLQDSYKIPDKLTGFVILAHRCYIDRLHWENNRLSVRCILIKQGLLSTRTFIIWTRGTLFCFLVIPLRDVVSKSVIILWQKPLHK
jgi:hypothetical protein